MAHALARGADRTSVILAMGGELVAHVDREALAERLASDNKRGHIPSSPGSVSMFLLRLLSEPVKDADGWPLTPVPLDMALTAFEKVAASEVI